MGIRRRIAMVCLLGGMVTVIVACGITETADQQAFKQAVTTNTVEGYLAFTQQYPDSPKTADAELAIGKLFRQGKQYDTAKQHYSDLAKARPADTRAAHTLHVIALESEGKTIACRYTAEAQGYMQILAGYWGTTAPLENEFTLKGSIGCDAPDMSVPVKVNEWALLWREPRQGIKFGEAGLREHNAKGKYIDGWGIVLREGDVIIPTEDYERLASGGPGYHYDYKFDAEPYDYLGKYTLIHVARSKQQGFFFPVVDYAEDDKLKSMQPPEMFPASVFTFSHTSNSKETGINMAVSITNELRTEKMTLSLFYPKETKKNAWIFGDLRGHKNTGGAQHLKAYIKESEPLRGMVRLVYKR